MRKESFKILGFITSGSAAWRPSDSEALARVPALAGTVTIAKTAGTVCYPARHLKPDLYHYSIRVPLSKKRPWAKRFETHQRCLGWIIPKQSLKCLRCRKRRAWPLSFLFAGCSRTAFGTQRCLTESARTAPTRKRRKQKKPLKVGFFGESRRNTVFKKGGYSNAALTRNKRRISDSQCVSVLK